MSEQNWYANKEIITTPARMFVGLAARTINKNEFNPATAKIAPLIGRYWAEGLFNKIPQRKNPGISYGVYTNYASNEHGEYDYLFGEEVNSVEYIPDGLSCVTIEPGKLLKFTTVAGSMPLVVIDAWQQIWKMSAVDLGGVRSYRGDFEVYDARAINPLSAVVDIYLGIK